MLLACPERQGDADSITDEVARARRGLFQVRGVFGRISGQSRFAIVKTERTLLWCSSPSYSAVTIPDGIDDGDSARVVSMSATISASARVAVAALVLATSVGAQSDKQIAFVHVADKQQRLRYLATAKIWSDPGDVTPEMLQAGRPLKQQSEALEAALRGQPLSCGFAKPGKDLGGNTPKFSCVTPDGTTIRVKYSDGSKDGNREIFSAVAAAKLLWALGFVSDPIYPITIDCRDCPADPMSGSGSRAKRSYLATFQPELTRLVMVDGDDADQGWRWGEVDEAIANLPEGELRARQRTHFDALTLLAVFIQHGDRKPEQQRLECRGALDPSKGDARPLGGDQSGASVFVERPDGSACSEPVIAVQDAGATFGGAGRTSNSSSKMNLKAWTNRLVFKSASSSGEVSECRGNLTVSMAAGEGGRGDPRIGEAGRAFLQNRLLLLTDAHVRALMATARVEKLSEPHTWRDPTTGTSHVGADAWVAAFKDKVRQITQRRCAP